jgi:hypothetical protein
VRQPTELIFLRAIGVKNVWVGNEPQVPKIIPLTRQGKARLKMLASKEQLKEQLEGLAG